jgi:hypothetical protein
MKGPIVTAEMSLLQAALAHVGAGQYASACTLIDIVRRVHTARDESAMKVRQLCETLYAQLATLAEKDRFGPNTTMVDVLLKIRRAV